MDIIEVQLEGPPPFKATGPGAKGAKNRQALFRAAAEKALSKWRAAQGASHVHFFPWDPMTTKISVAITYMRVKGENDAANIIGGVSDALQSVFYANDKQVREIGYKELQRQDSTEDSLRVRISALDRPKTVVPAEKPNNVKQQPSPSAGQTDQDEEWQKKIDEAWSSRAPGSGVAFPGPQAAADAAKVLGASNLSESQYGTIQKLLDASPLLSSKWQRKLNTVIRI